VTNEAKLRGVDAAMSVANDIADGRLDPDDLDAATAAACQALFGTVAGPDDPLWSLQADVTRQVIAAGGIPANELQEWLAVQRSRDAAKAQPEPNTDNVREATNIALTCPDYE
jgi:hypothetical protein